jgi:hypothetical protein
VSESLVYLVTRAVAECASWYSTRDPRVDARAARAANRYTLEEEEEMAMSSASGPPMVGSPAESRKASRTSPGGPHSSHITICSSSSSR